MNDPRLHRRSTVRRQRGFSLPELLIAIFLLGIGVISIATLFPVGLTQQRRSTDDLLGAIVANNALSLIRAKVGQDDFGYANSPGWGLVDLNFQTIPGDFKWRRPGFVFGTTPALSAISLFENGDTLTELPYNFVKWGPTPPSIIITQGERYYPAATIDPANPDRFLSSNRPQYVWDCAFRRFGGKVYVAIFVYRVEAPGGETAPYAVAPGATNIAPLPVVVDLTQNNVNNAWDVWGADGIMGTPDDRIIPNTERGTPLSSINHGAPYQGFFLNEATNQGWQMPGQWLLDQNNNVHRVLSGRRSISDGPLELVERIPEVPLFSPSFRPGVGGAITNPSFENVVQHLWYIPPTDANGWTLTPVYMTVKEL